MKKYLKIILTLTFICILVFFSYKTVIKINYKKVAAQNIKTIPEFSYKDINGLFFNNHNIKINTPTLFIYFDSGCEYCNEEAEMIKKNIEKFKNIQLIFVSFEQPALIKTFATKHHLISYQNIHFLYDNKITFAKTFDINSLPYLILYDKDQKLIAKIKGQTKTEILLKKLTSE